MIHFKTFTNLPEESKMIRINVFMEEQGFKNEFDVIDNRAIHIVLYKEGKPVGTCRVFWDGEMQAYLIGRVAVLKNARGNHYGTELLKEAEQVVVDKGESVLCLAAQLTATPFYESLGYKAYGEAFFDEHCPHIWMKKKLS